MPPTPYISTADSAVGTVYAVRHVANARLTDDRDAGHIAHRYVEAARFFQTPPSATARPALCAALTTASHGTTTSPPTPPTPRTPFPPPPPPAGAGGSGGLGSIHFLGLGKDQERQRVSEAEHCRDLDAARIAADLPTSYDIAPSIPPNACIRCVSDRAARAHPPRRRGVRVTSCH
ncbi:hypothetical protein B0H13DRAFT_725598 [Mycena leptocephala]|nr:hypothetical protein B0H13DRAFT_725598 [Mycena leptocephala]